MGVYKRGDVWWVRFTTPKGQRIRCSAQTKDRTQAQEYCDKQRARHWEIQRLGVKPERSWQEAVVRWLKETSHKKSHGNDVRNLRWIDPFLGHLMLHEVTRDQVEVVGETKRVQASPATANRMLALVRAILRRARDEWGWIDHIPKVRLYREVKKRVRWITREEAARLLNVLPIHLRDMAEFTLATGLRQSNVSNLRWDQVDMQRQVAWIHHDEAKAGKAIGVPLNRDACEVLRRRIGKDQTYVFTFRSKPLKVGSTKAWYLALQKAGITDFRWHDLRHTWASWHVQNGTSLHELMELGGWSSYEMVMRYAHLASGQLTTAARRIESTNLAQSASREGPRRILSP